MSIDPKLTEILADILLLVARSEENPLHMLRDCIRRISSAYIKLAVIKALALLFHR